VSRRPRAARRRTKRRRLAARLSFALLLVTAALYCGLAVFRPVLIPPRLAVRPISFTMTVPT